MPKGDFSLGTALKMPPKDAIAYFEAKGYRITFDWHEMREGAHAKAFTVAHAARMDVLSDIRGRMQKVLDQGIGEKQFVDVMTHRLKAAGWWGKEILVDKQGGARQVQLGSPHRLRTIYRTNMATAFNAARFKQQKENADGRPYWQYIAVMDNRTRPSHAALHDKVFRHDDPIWGSIYPPNGFGCRCRVRAYSEHRLQQKALAVDSSEGQLRTEQVEVAVDKRTGEVITREGTVWNGKDRFGQPATFRPDPGWSYNPGEAAFGTDVDLMRKLTQVEDRAIRTQVVQAINNAPERQLAFGAWVTQVLPRRGTGHSAQTVHLMSEEVADFSRQHGAEPARVMVMNERNVAHVESAKHIEDGIALSPDELRRLPELLARPETRVYWDQVHQNVLYAVPISETETILVPTTPMRNLKKVKGRLDQVVSAFKISDRRLATDKKRFDGMKP
jgi:SPP1 gp7 family putative phage head morphogenesis protein